IALQMFQYLMEDAGRQIEILARNTLPSEVVTLVRDEKPAVIVIASFPPGGLTQAQYLCKRIRSIGISIKIMTARWGATENLAIAKQRLTSAGADRVAQSLLEARTQIAPWLKEASHQNGAQTALVKTG